MMIFLVAAQALAAQQAISSGAFVVRLGRDTLSVEQFTRTANRLEGDLVRRSPTTNVTHYVINTKPDGSIASAELTMKRADGSVVRTLSPQIPAATFIMLPESYAPYELWLAQLRSTKRDSADVTVVAPLGGPCRGSWRRACCRAIPCECGSSDRRYGCASMAQGGCSGSMVARRRSSTK